MKQDILNTVILAGAFLLLFGIAECGYHILKVKAELTRKIVHIGTGLLTLLFPLMLHNQWPVLLLCTSFAIILVVSLRFKLLPSINAIERESVGSIAYPVAVYGCYLAYDYLDHQLIYFYLPILILAICDPIAALTGKKWPKGKYNIGGESKTLMGSSMFFASAFIINILLLKLLSAETIMLIAFQAVVISLFASMAEAISKKGFDNITIPVAVLIGLILTKQLS